MKTFQVIQSPEWSAPNMLVFVNEANEIIGQQVNPQNALTQEWADDGETWGQFNPANYQFVTEV